MEGKTAESHLQDQTQFLLLSQRLICRLSVDCCSDSNRPVNRQVHVQLSSVQQLYDLMCLAVYLACEHPDPDPDPCLFHTPLSRFYLYSS